MAECIFFSCHHGLDSYEKVRGDHHGIDSEVRVSAVCGPAFDLDKEAVRGSHHLSAAHTDGSHRVGVFHMKPEDRVHMGILQNAVRNHKTAAADVLLCRFKYEFYISVHLIAVAGQQNDSAHQGCSVGIMAAGVHDTVVLGPIGEGIHLLKP